MPAFYAHDRFGKKVYSRLEGEIKQTIKNHSRQFRIGLQGPDLFFFYRPWHSNKVSKYGNHLHEISAYPFFRHGAAVVREKGRNSKEYAYLLGFVCHFILDSECHPFVEAYIKKSGVQHLEIEEEFEKLLLRMDGKDPFAYPLADLVPADETTAEAICPYYDDITEKTALQSLKDMRLVKKLFTAPGRLKHDTINTVMKLTGKYPYMKGLMNQHRDNLRCRKSSQELLRRFDGAVHTAVDMIYSLDETIQTGKELNKRFDRTFE